jgi:hypothetical protein
MPAITTYSPEDTVIAGLLSAGGGRTEAADVLFCVNVREINLDILGKAMG